MTTSLSDEEKIKKFFRVPVPGEGFEVNETYTGESSLFILRRDAKICLSKNGSIHEQAIWPAVLAILAGIDLLGQYYGNRKFEEFCTSFFTFDDEHNSRYDQAHGLYMLRNAFMHNYSLFSKTINGNTEYEFTVTYEEQNAKLIEKISDTPFKKQYKIDLAILYDRFEEAANKFRDCLLENKHNEQEAFFTAYNVYGLIGPTIQPSGFRGTGSAPSISGPSISAPISGSVIIRV